MEPIITSRQFIFYCVYILFPHTVACISVLDLHAFADTQFVIVVSLFAILWFSLSFLALLSFNVAMRRHN